MVKNLYFALTVTSNQINCIELRNVSLNVKLMQKILCNLESMAMDDYGNVMDKPYQCSHCHSIRTQASQNRTMMNECMNT